MESIIDCAENINEINYSFHCYVMNIREREREFDLNACTGVYFETIRGHIPSWIHWQGTLTNLTLIFQRASCLTD